MEIMSFIFIVTLICMNRMDRGYLSFSKILLILILAFHYIPLIYLHLNYDILPIGYLPEELTTGIMKVLIVCLFISFGVLLSRYCFSNRNIKLLTSIRNPRITLWFRVNIITGSIILLNNLIASYRALNSGYLDIYASSQTFIPIKTITILPIYAFTLFYLLLTWISARQVFNKKFRYSFFGVLFALLVSFTFTGSRSTAIYFVLTLLAIWSARYKIKMWEYIPHAIGLVLISVIIGVLREGSYSGLGFSALFLRPIVELANTAIVLLNCDTIANEFALSVTRYLSGLMYLFPISLLHSLGIEPPSLLSQQYVNIVDPGWADMGGGFGFSLVSEMYLLGGKGGAWLIALITGILVGWIDINLKSTNVSKSALAASIGFFMFFIVRGELMELYRNVAVVFFLYLFTIIRITIKSTHIVPVSTPESMPIKTNIPND